MAAEVTLLEPGKLGCFCQGDTLVLAQSHEGLEGFLGRCADIGPERCVNVKIILKRAVSVHLPHRHTVLGQCLPSSDSRIGASNNSTYTPPAPIQHSV